MKKLFSFLLAITFYTFSSLQPAHAIFCGNCSTIVTQIMELAESYISGGANVLTSINTSAETLNKYVLDPLANSMLAAVQIQKQVSTINFITAAFGNEGSLLIQNPEQWIKNKGKAQVQIALGNIQQQNGLYKDSLLASVIGTYKSADDLNKTLKDLSSSNIPSAIQKNICNDSSLTNLAKNEVMLTDGSYDPNRLQARKSELYRTLCTSNPQTNMDLARTLNAINQQLPGAGGWDAWLLTVGGDNPYAHSVQANILIAQKKAEAEQAKKDELNRNGGIANKTNCTSRAFPVNDDDGNAMPNANDTSLPCVIEQITQTGNALNSQFQEALNAPLRKLQASFGTGIFKSLSSIMSIIGSARELSSAFESMGGSSNSSGGSTQVTRTQDLTDPTRQAQTAESPKEVLTKHLDSLVKLESIEARMQSALSGYESQVNGIQTCFDGVVAQYKEQYPSIVNDRSVTDAASFVSGKLSYTQSLRQQSQDTLGKVSTTRTLINETLSFIDASQSTEEIVAKFKEYQKAVDTQRLPGIMSAAEREGEIAKFNADVMTDTMEGGSIPTYRLMCTQLQPVITNPGDGGF